MELALLTGVTLIGTHCIIVYIVNVSQKFTHTGYFAVFSRYSRSTVTSSVRGHSTTVCNVLRCNILRYNIT